MIFTFQIWRRSSRCFPVDPSHAQCTQGIAAGDGLDGIAPKLIWQPWGWHTCRIELGVTEDCDAHGGNNHHHCNCNDEYYYILVLDGVIITSILIVITMMVAVMVGMMVMLMVMLMMMMMIMIMIVIAFIRILVLIIMPMITMPIKHQPNCS